MLALASLAHPLHLAVALAYLAALIGVGLWKASSVRTQEDFSLAGRGLSAPVLVGTLVATWIGTGSVFGNAEESYRVGLPAFLLPLSGSAGILVLWMLAGRIRGLAQFTIQDVLEERFGPAARVLGTLALLCGYVIIVSYQYRAGAAVLGHLAPELSPRLATTLVALFVVAYTALAGLISVAYTDVANGVLMTLGIGLALPLCVLRAGGPGEVVASLPEGGRELFGHYGVARTTAVLLPAFLLILGDANMYQRFFAARTRRSATWAAAGMLVGVLALELAIIALAVSGRALVEQGQLAAPVNPGHVIVDLAFGVLPPWLGALLVATLLAVIVSTADSYLLSPASAVVRDLYQRFFAREADDRQQVRAGRLVVVALGAVALLLAFESERFFSVALFAYTLYGASITPPLLAAFFWPRATPAGAVGAMLAGLLGASAWRFGGGAALARVAGDAGQDGLATFLAEIGPALPAVLFSSLVLVTLSLLFPGPRPAPARP